MIRRAAFFALSALLAASPVFGQNAAPDDSGKAELRAWLGDACPMISDEVRRKELGAFRELDPPFLERLASFERRLCARTLARADERYLFDQGPYLAVEAQLLKVAGECGYLDALVFPAFARNYLILGETALRSGDAFRCNPSQHFSDALSSMRFASDEVEFRIRDIERFGNEDSSRPKLEFTE